ncbi:MAG: HAD hydrolase family protein [Lachnospiraceae bacterium]|nr:HAD hydrolase family protein [Lachnospiraceae bacterium]
MKERLSKIEFPLVGQRIIRSCIGVFLCYLVYFLRGQNSMVFFSVVAVLLCIQPDMQNSFKMAKQRMLGTAVGSIWGLFVIFITHQWIGVNLVESIFGYLVIAFFAGIVLYSTVVLRIKEASALSAIIFLSIAAAPMMEQTPLIFAGNRFLDTFIGVLIAIAINACRLPRERNCNILFVSGIDDIMIDRKKLELSSYSKIELNYLIEKGALFTISTWRTPASLVQLTDGLHINQPVITMSGAALYDMANNRYVATCGIRYENAQKLLQYFEENNINYFANVVVNDSLLIFYREIESKAEHEIFSQMRDSPYLNLVQRKVPVGEAVVYFMMINTVEKTQALYQSMLAESWSENYRLVFYKNEDNTDYASLKIYAKYCNPQNMLEQLKANLEVDAVVTFGSAKQGAGVIIENADGNLMVREMRKLFEPIRFLKRR